MHPETSGVFCLFVSYVASVRLLKSHLYFLLVNWLLYMDGFEEAGGQLGYYFSVTSCLLLLFWDKVFPWPEAPQLGGLPNKSQRSTCLHLPVLPRPGTVWTTQNLVNYSMPTDTRPPPPSLAPLPFLPRSLPLSLFCFWDRVFLYSLGCSGSGAVDQASLQLNSCTCVWLPSAG